MRKHLTPAAFLVLVPFLWTARPDQPAPRTEQPRGALDPEKARAAFRLDPGLRIELVACEPQIESPVAMAFDPAGRLWVVEMRDYPNGPEKGTPAQGRIRILEDKDGDGFFETSRVFTGNLLFANGLMPWKGGAIVTVSPRILQFDRDAKPTVLFEGFTAGNPQLRLSSPVLGPDGWVTMANGLRGGQVVRLGKKTDKPSKEKRSMVLAR